MYIPKNKHTHTHKEEEMVNSLATQARDFTFCSSKVVVGNGPTLADCRHNNIIVICHIIMVLKVCVTLLPIARILYWLKSVTCVLPKGMGIQSRGLRIPFSILQL